MYKQQDIQNLFNILSALKAGKINIIAASRKIDSLRFNLNPDDELFLIFRMIASDWDEYPINEAERANWDKQALERLDNKFLKYAADIKSDLNKACDNINKKYLSFSKL